MLVEGRGQSTTKVSPWRSTGNIFCPDTVARSRCMPGSAHALCATPRAGFAPATLQRSGRIRRTWEGRWCMHVKRLFQGRTWRQGENNCVDHALV